MTDKKILAVFGATGHQGGAIISHFLNRTSSPYRVRALTRNTSSAAAQKLANFGAEVVHADLDDLDSLPKALNDAHAVFLVTDFFSCADEGAQRETAQAKRVLDVLAESITLEHLIYSSLPSIRQVSEGKYNHVVHFDGKASVADQLQSTYKELSKKTTVLWVGTYMQLWQQFSDVFAPKKTITEDEKELWVQRLVFNPETHMPLVDVRDVGKAVQSILTVGDELKGGKTVSLMVADKVSIREQLEVWGAHVGKESVFEHISDQQSLSQLKKLGLPEFIVKAIWEVGLAYRDYEGKLLHQEGVIQASEILLEGEKLTTWGDFVYDNDWSDFMRG